MAKGLKAALLALSLVSVSPAWASVDDVAPRDSERSVRDRDDRGYDDRDRRSSRDRDDRDERRSRDDDSGGGWGLLGLLGLAGLGGLVPMIQARRGPRAIDPTRPPPL